MKKSSKKSTFNSPCLKAPTNPWKGDKNKVFRSYPLDELIKGINAMSIVKRWQYILRQANEIWLWRVVTADIY